MLYDIVLSTWSVAICLRVYSPQLTCWPIHYSNGCKLL